MEALIVLIVFGFPVAVVGLVTHYRYKTKQLAAGQAAPDQLLLARCEELEQRIQTLETIVCEGDLDAVAKMHALAKQTDAKRLAAPKPTEE